MPTPFEYARDLRAALQPCLARGKRASSSASDLARQLERVPVRSLSAVDEALRNGSLGYDDGWYELGPAQLGQLSGLQDGWAILALAASHRIGFVRQAALEQLRRRGDPRAVPFIVMRLNDWVAQVRLAASLALASFMTPGFAPALVSALPLVLALQRQSRGDHTAVVTAILDLLRSNECRPALLAGFTSPDRELRRTCYRIALAGADASIVERALGDRDPAIRLWGTREAGQRLAQPWAPALLRRALSDSSVQVRRAALSLLADVLPADEACRLLEAALLDENTSARWRARILRLGRGPLDLAGFYRRALSEAETRARLRGALLGLGESGAAVDIAAVTAYLGPGAISVRRAALRALSALEADSSTEPFLAALVDPMPGVSREAGRALRSRLRFVPVRLLAELIAASDRAAHARRNALSLANCLSKWDALPLLLEGAAAAEPEVVARGRMLLLGWFARYNKSFVLPAPGQIERIDQVWSRVAAVVPVREELEQLVRLARRLAAG